MSEVSYSKQEHTSDLERSGNDLPIWPAVEPAIEHHGPKHGKVLSWTVGVCVWTAAFAYAMQSSASYSYSVWATSSFQNHSAGLSVLLVATSIIGSVSRLSLAKMTDVWGPNPIYILGAIFCAIGYSIISQSETLTTYIVGNVFAMLGGTAISFMNSMVVAHMTNLQWRGLFSAFLSVPYLITPWLTAAIVAKLGSSINWRWGYGMYALILPACTCPIIAVLFWLSLRAKSMVMNATADISPGTEDRKKKDDEALVVPFWKRAREILLEFDAFGLTLLGFGWTLSLLPFSLAGSANGHWNNPSLVTMMIVGLMSLIAYALYEVLAAPFPSVPRRILMNRTFMMCVLIQFIHEFAGYLQFLYMSSYTYVVSDWSLQGWSYYNNTLSLSLCAFGVIAGALQRITHRYKFLQVAGLCIKIVGFGVMISPNSKIATKSTTLLTLSSILIGAGGSFSVIGSTVAAQAAVPALDMTFAMALLSFWSMVGGSISSSIAAVLWAKWMPRNLHTYLPESVDDTRAAEFYADITLIRAYAYDDPVRQGAIEAYQRTLWGLAVPALVLSFVTLGAACFQSDFILGQQHNAVIHVAADGKPRPADQMVNNVNTEFTSPARRAFYLMFGV